tara:strand:- start:33 stop:551 length:519 start_codon:yes stop_codon:yes gene_type:complete
MSLKKYKLLLLIFLISVPVKSEEQKTLEVDNEYNFYVGTFDTIDKEGDDQTSLFGLEHNSDDLVKETNFGKFSPVTGGFISGNNSVYLYTGVQAKYALGPLKVIPSFTPGLYEAGDGKDLGSVLEFKSEIRFDLDIFKNSKLGYSYNHISNNDWGSINPGTNNQLISFSSKF